ncbi:ribonuclease inhibitor-like [Hoplias malabaricus]|uniref:ribonuclease inhibitor-like n=1 Tax=Hoplias malabaricus TaxID=27720 RepID=UPI00346335A5
MSVSEAGNSGSILPGVTEPTRHMDNTTYCSEVTISITNSRKARLAGYNLTEELIKNFNETLQSEDSSLQELDLSYSDLKVSNLRDGLKTLETLRLRKCKLIEEAYDTVQSVQQSENCLKTLDLSYIDLQDAEVNMLYEGLMSPHCKLETLRLTMCKLEEKACEKLNAVLRPNSSLKELDLSNNALWDSGVEKLCEGLRIEHCKLEKLKLTMCNLGEKACEKLNAFLRPNSSLKELDLSNNALCDSGVARLFAGLESEHWKLEILRLGICNLGNGTCEQLSSVLKPNTSLKVLDLSNNNLYDQGVEKLCERLSEHCKLETLRLAECSLKKPCKKLTKSSLKELDLSNNDLQDSGVKKLCEGLKSPLCKLEILRLSGCMITKKGCTSLASALSSNPSHLKELVLSYNHPKATGEKQLFDKKKDSKCRLETLWLDHAGKIRIKPGVKKYACELSQDPDIKRRCPSPSFSSRMEPLYEDPEHAVRIDVWQEVLCRESLTGRCYWETEWSGQSVYISVVYKSVRENRDGEHCTFGKNEKSWSLCWHKKNYSVFHNNRCTYLGPPQFKCKRIGVYVDCEAGILSFYSVSTETNQPILFYTFSTTFMEPLCAGYNIWDLSSSVTLCQVK